MLRSAVLLGLVALAVLSGPAEAASVAYSTQETFGYKDSSSFSGRYTLTAAPGEVNRITVERTRRDTVVFRDAAAPIEPGDSGCEPFPGGVRCSERKPAFRTELLIGAVVEAGDGDDRVDVRATTLGTVTVRGGAGDDVLDATAVEDEGAAVLDGGDGADLLTAGERGAGLQGGAGPDRLVGGDGGDGLVGDGGGAAPADDVIEGGGGTDLLSYEDRTAPVAVDLADPGPDGGAGEADRVRDVESVTGGSGADRLAGDGAVNRLIACVDGGRLLQCGGGDVLLGRGGRDYLYGSGGADRLDGGAGPDRLSAGAGDDRLTGGAGDDRLELFDGRPGGADHVSCGAGRDRVFMPGNGDAAAGDCETAALGELTLAVARDRVVAQSAGSRCRADLTLRPAGGRASRVRFDLREDRRQARRVSPPLRGDLRVTVRTRDCVTFSRRLSATFRLGVG